MGETEPMSTELAESVSTPTPSPEGLLPTEGGYGLPGPSRTRLSLGIPRRSCRSVPVGDRNRH